MYQKHVFKDEYNNYWTQTATQTFNPMLCGKKIPVRSLCSWTMCVQYDETILNASDF